MAMTRVDFISATTVGNSHRENQDRVLTRQVTGSPEMDIIAVSDGISCCPFGGSVARWIIETHLAADVIGPSAAESVEQVIREYLHGLNAMFRQEFDELEEMLHSGATLSLAVHCAGAIHCFWVGDSPIYATIGCDGGFATRRVSLPDSGSSGSMITDWFGGTSPFELKHTALPSSTSIVTITSDGAAHESETLNDAYSRLGFSQEVAEEVVRESRRNSIGDDASIVAMRVFEVS
jgi:serine/threonine protein phosphatase PrpC